MLLIKKTVLFTVALLTLTAGSFPPGTIICQAVDGELIIESSCECKNEVPPCCEEDECHDLTEVAENSDGTNIFASDECFDTLVYVEHYTEQDAATIAEKISEPSSFTDYLLLIAEQDYPLDVGKEFCPDPPPLPSANLNIIRTTVLLI